MLVGLFFQSAYAKAKIFVAASLVDVVEELAQASGIQDLNVVAGSSSSLARQIKAGAPADLFISANRDWATFVAGEKDLVPLFSNRLVLISHQDVAFIDLASLLEKLGSKRLAMADSDHVPAGIYARQALEHAGLWEVLKKQIAPADNVRSAVRLVQSGAAPFGVAYASDAKLLNLNVAFAFAPETHDQIVYWAVPIKPENPDIDVFGKFLGSENARAIVASYGFMPLKGQ